jgi:hypothetical protein
MALLDRIQKMKQTGLSETQITNSLMQEGISPREINDALGQAKIKSAISEPAQNAEMNEQGMQQSIMEQSVEQSSVQNQPTATQPIYQEQAYAYPTEQGYYQDPNQQTNYGQDPNQPVYYQQAMDMETVRDITRQEIEDSLKKVRQDLDSLNKIKSEIKFEVQNVDSRLTRIESIIQELQSAIIRKMGDYGEAISGISEELKSTQNSFSKMINPLMDNKRGYQEQEEEKQEPTPPKPKKQQENQPKNRQKNDSKASVEDYFR